MFFSVLRAVYMGDVCRLNGISKWKTQDTAAFQEDEVKEEAARLNNEWLALFHSDTEDEYFEGF